MSKQALRERIESKAKAKAKAKAESTATAAVDAARIAVESLRHAAVIVRGSAFVANPPSQFLCNSRVSGVVTVKTPVGETITIELRDEWLNRDSSGNCTKNAPAAFISRMLVGAFDDPQREVARQIAYLALGIPRSRLATPREGAIKSKVLTEAYLARGYTIESIVDNERGTINPQDVIAKANRLLELVAADLASGRYSIRKPLMLY